MTDSSARLFTTADRLYRWRWWMTASLIGAYIALGASAGVTDPIDWSMFILMLLLVWAPALAHWFQAARAARAAFHEGCSDEGTKQLRSTNGPGRERLDVPLY